MIRHLRHRLRAKDGDPGPTAWLIAAVSLVLPVAGLVLCIAGGFLVMRGDADGWSWLGAGAAAIVLDILIDFAWAHPKISESDQPDLNRRGEQLIGRAAIVTEPIEGGRGKVRIGDTLWPAEGPDTSAGATVRVVGTRVTVLIVEPQQSPEAHRRP